MMKFKITYFFFIIVQWSLFAAVLQPLQGWHYWVAYVMPLLMPLDVPLILTELLVKKSEGAE